MTKDEVVKAVEDATTSGRGIGFLKVTAEGVRHVPQDEVYRLPTERDWTDATMHAGLPKISQRDIDAMNNVIDCLYKNRSKK